MKTAPGPGGLAVEVLRREFRLTRALYLDGITRALALMEGKDEVALVLGSSGELPLERLLRDGRLPLTTSLTIASRVADALSSLHEGRLVHHDLRPANILVEPATSAVKLTGLGFATPLSEQTGCLNRPVDQRTDFYSLGVTLIEMLTERPPFQFDDRMELAHAYLTKQPPSPTEVVPEVPEAVSRTVLKLLSRSADDGYQHARDIKADLERCLRDLQGAGRIRAFEPGGTDSAAPTELRGETKPAVSGPEALDAVGITETAATLSRASDLQELLGELLSVLLRTSGAERGLLLRDDGARLVVEASASMGTDGIDISTGPSCRKRKEFVRSVVEHVRASQEVLVIDDALHAEHLLGDDYVASRRPRSILSAPLVHRKKLVGLVYLENNSRSGAFDGKQMLAVRLISSHAATAMENARLRECLARETSAALQIRKELGQVQKQLGRTVREKRKFEARLEAEEVCLREELASRPIVGKSRVLQKVLRQVELVAPTQACVLLTGETGTGKDLIARAIHVRSRRRKRPMVKVDCTALPETLIEAELFGHEKGAFTGAHARRIGRFEAADGATLFLDEIGELPLQLQAKLLRILEEQQFERLGSARTIKIDVRIIAATNRSLAAAVAEGTFRSDLFYRLNVFPIKVPPLRARPEDIPALVEHFVARHAKRMGKFIEVPTELMSELEAAHWPGNVRELEHVIERAIIMSPSSTLTLDGSFLVRGSGDDRTERYRLEDVERTHIVKVLDKSGWAVKGEGNAADLLDMNPSTLRSRMKKLGIVRPSKSGPALPRHVTAGTHRPMLRERLSAARAENQA